MPVLDKFGHYGIQFVCGSLRHACLLLIPLFCGKDSLQASVTVFDAKLHVKSAKRLPGSLPSIYKA